MDRFDDCVIMIHRGEKQSNLEMIDTKLYTPMNTKRSVPKYIWTDFRNPVQKFTRVNRWDGSDN